MKTLIKLMGDRPIENILSAEVYRPEEIIFLCPEDIAENAALWNKLAEFFAGRGYRPRIRALSGGLLDSGKMLEGLETLRDRFADCALDVTGSTETAIFAAGMLAERNGIPAFTYSRHANRFYSVFGADFAGEIPESLRYNTGDFILMAGGRMRGGRVDNSALDKYLSVMEPYFEIYTRYRKEWTSAVNWFQALSQERIGETTEADLEIRGDRGRKLRMPKDMMKELQRIGLIRDLKFPETGKVSFRYVDEMTRFWLRDVGSVLELYVYKICRDSGLFHDVVSSVIADWDASAGKDSVTNEIDAVAVRGIVPLFISCKTCAIKTEALNELAILKERFGGSMAKALIVTGEHCNAAARHRAAQLGITVVDREELSRDKLIHRLRVIMKVEKM